MDIAEQLKQRLADIMKFFRDEISSIRGSRPSPALVEDVQVEYYGQKMPVKQLGSISVVPPRDIQITVWDANAADVVAKAVSAKLNLQAAREGNTIHANLPSLTQERRNELLKAVRGKAEEARIKSRTVRDDLKKEVAAQEKSGSMTEDDRFQLQEQMQKEVDAFNKEIDALLEKKTAEINE
jgi:ribosome recycling factor